MYKIFTITIDNTAHQCELIAIFTDELNGEEFQYLTIKDKAYSAILETLNENEEVAELLKNKQLCYRIKPIEHYFMYQDGNILPSLKRPESFMKNGISTPFAIQVFENIYYFSEQKKLVAEQIETQQLVFSIYSVDEDDIPSEAIPLLTFAPTESNKMKQECRNVLRSFRMQFLIDTFYLVISQIEFTPSTLIKLIFIGLISYAATQNANQAPIQRRKMPNIGGPEDLTLIVLNADGTPASEEAKSIILNDAKKIINEKRINPYPQFNHPSALEHYFLEAIQTDNLHQFKHALKNGYDLLKRNAKGDFTFMQTARYNRPTLIDYVANTLKIDLNLFQKSSKTNGMGESWMVLVMNAGHDQLTEQLVKWGVDLNHLFLSGNNLLHLLSVKQNPNDDSEANLKHIRQLVQLGANINILDSRGVSPVFFAALEDQVKVVKFFLEKNCKTQLKSHNLLSAALLASSLETVECILQYGLDPHLNAANYLKGEPIANHNVPLVSAVIRGDTAFIDLLIKYKANFSLYPKLSIELFLSAFRKKNINMAYYLVKRGVTMDYFYVILKMLNNKNAPAIEITTSFLNTITQWMEIKAELNGKKQSKMISNYFQIDPDALEIPQFVIFYKQLGEMRNACEDNNFKRFKKALNELKSIHELTEHVKQIEEDLEDSIIPDSIVRVFQNKKQEIDANFKLLWQFSSYLLVMMPLIAVMFAFKKIILANQQKREEQPRDNRDKKITPQKTKPDALSHNKTKINLPILQQIKANQSHVHIDITPQLQQLNEHIKQCEHEQTFCLKNSELFIMNRKNALFKNYKQVDLEKGFRHSQIKLNHMISTLHEKIANLLEFKPVNNLHVINACQTDIEQYKSELTRYLLNDNSEKFPEYDINSCILQIETIKHIRLQFQKDWKETEDLIEKIDNAQGKLTKQKQAIKSNLTTENKSITQEPIMLEIRPLKSSERSVKSTKIKTTNSDNDKKIITKKTNLNLTNSTSSFFTNTDKIQNDHRVIFANELLRYIENLIKNDEYEVEYKREAALYLLMKTSHLLAQLGSEEYGHRTIIIYSWKDLYNLRNNLVHYPEYCFKNNIILDLLQEFFNLFDLPLRHLKAKGKCDMIYTKTLAELCPFLLDDHNNTLEINRKDTEQCIADLNALLEKTEFYYKEAVQLEMGEKYAHAGILHCAMHGIILQFREEIRAIKRSNYALFEQIHGLIPDIIPSGHQVAHKINEDKSWKLTTEERKYYAQEDIPPYALLNLIKQIVLNKESILLKYEEAQTKPLHRISKGI